MSDQRLLADARAGRWLAPGRQVFVAIKSVAIDGRSLSRQNPTADLEGEAEEVFDSLYRRAEAGRSDRSPERS